MANVLWSKTRVAELTTEVTDVSVGASIHSMEDERRRRALGVEPKWELPGEGPALAHDECRLSPCQHLDDAEVRRLQDSIAVSSDAKVEHA